VRTFLLPFHKDMIVRNTKRFIARPQATWVILQFKKRDSSTTSSKKLTSSYYHHVSPRPFVYKTISQSFDETAAKYSDHECYVFKGISIHMLKFNANEMF
jgi:hypothetical protein